MSYMKDFIEEVRAMTLHGSSVQHIAAVCDVPEHMVEGAIDILMEDSDFREQGDFDEPEPIFDFDDEPLNADGDEPIYTDHDDGRADFYDGEYVI